MCRLQCQRVTGILRGLVCRPPSAALAQTKASPRKVGKSTSASGRVARLHAPPSQGRAGADHVEALPDARAKTARGGGSPLSSSSTGSSRRHASPSGSLGSNSGVLGPCVGVGGTESAAGPREKVRCTTGPPSQPANRVTSPPSASTIRNCADRYPSTPSNVPSATSAPVLHHGTARVAGALVEMPSGNTARSEGIGTPRAGLSHDTVRGTQRAPASTSQVSQAAQTQPARPPSTAPPSTSFVEPESGAPASSSKPAS